MLGKANHAYRHGRASMTRTVIIDGCEMTVLEACSRPGAPSFKQAMHRMLNGWTPERAVTTPINQDISKGNIESRRLKAMGLCKPKRYRRGSDPVFEITPFTLKHNRAAPILDEVATKHALDPTLITGLSMSPEVTAARREFAARLRDELDWTFPQIGKLLHRHHTTVMIMVRRYHELTST